MFMLLQEHVTKVKSVAGYVYSNFTQILFVHSLSLCFISKDCAGAILYSTEKAVEVALEGMQCLGLCKFSPISRNTDSQI